MKIRRVHFSSYIILIKTLYITALYSQTLFNTVDQHVKKCPCEINVHEICDFKTLIAHTYFQALLSSLK